MDVFHVPSRKRETYDVEITYSLLWESALGIAAITNKPLLSTLEKTEKEWEEMKETLTQELIDEIDYLETNNTWKTLLQILHEDDFKELTEFTEYIRKLPNESLKLIAIPFLGNKHEELRQLAARGENNAIQTLQHLTNDHPFFPIYIEFIARVDPEKLKTHLIQVMEGWYKEIISPESESLFGMLQRDAQTKQKMAQDIDPEKFVEWATGGVHYLPEPSVHQVLLIPHHIYRPWNIEADLKGTKVFYYPIANESLNPSDSYMPSFSLIQKHKALGDEVRLRIVKLLSERDCTLQELTDRLGMGKSTVHHHVKTLKAAKIVDSLGAKYKLRESSLEALGLELQEYINQY